MVQRVSTGRHACLRGPLSPPSPRCTVGGSCISLAAQFSAIDRARKLPPPNGRSECHSERSRRRGNRRPHRGLRGSRGICSAPPTSSLCASRPAAASRGRAACASAVEASAAGWPADRATSPAVVRTAVGARYAAQIGVAEVPEQGDGARRGLGWIPREPGTPSCGREIHASGSARNDILSSRGAWRCRPHRNPAPRKQFSPLSRYRATHYPQVCAIRDARTT